MATIAMDGLGSGPVRDAVLAELGDPAVHDLGQETFAPCTGCFECWIERPGFCKAHDGANDLMHDVIGSTLQVWLTPVRYGTWGATTKSALDKCIGLLSPFFRTLYGETHHAARYRRYPAMLAVGVLDPCDTAQDAERFRTLVSRNALNFQAPACEVVVVPSAASVIEVRLLVRDAVARIRATQADGPPARADEVPPPRILPDESPGIAARSDGAPRRALLVVGSAKPAGTSASESLGRALLRRLELRGWQTGVVHLGSAVKLSHPTAPKLTDAVAEADLVVLATPVYVDTLPALVTAAFDRLEGARGKGLLPIVQCGFPERVHTDLAVEVARTAGERHGMRWMGHLALGGGGAIADPDLDALGGRVHAQREALDLAADALDRGQVVPRAAIEGFARPSLPSWAYRLLGQVGWLGQAWTHRALRHLGDRPFPEAG